MVPIEVATLAEALLYAYIAADDEQATKMAFTIVEEMQKRGFSFTFESPPQ